MPLESRPLATRCAVLATLFAAIAAGACIKTPKLDPPAPPGPPPTVATHPRAADRFARLLLRQLTDTSPVWVQQLISCEQSRLSYALGVHEMIRRTQGVRDTIFRTRAERTRHEQVQGEVAMQVYESGGLLCDSIMFAADREEGPILPVIGRGYPRDSLGKRRRP